MEAEPEGPYVYQPFGVNEQAGTRRLWGVGGVHRPFNIGVDVSIKGLTREEAEAVCDALRDVQGLEPPLPPELIAYAKANGLICDVCGCGKKLCASRGCNGTPLPKEVAGEKTGGAE